MARAKAIAMGQEPSQTQQTSGDSQLDKIQQSVRRIKMRTQQSTNRYEPPQDMVATDPVEASPEIPRLTLMNRQWFRKLPNPLAHSLRRS